MKKMKTSRRDGTRTRTAKARTRDYRAARRVKYASSDSNAVEGQ